MKIQRISEFQYKIDFQSREAHLTAYKESFLSSNLGKIYQSIPWYDLVNTLGLKDSKKRSSEYLLTKRESSSNVP